MNEKGQHVGSFSKELVNKENSTRIQSLELPAKTKVYHTVIKDRIQDCYDSCVYHDRHNKLHKYEISQEDSTDQQGSDMSSQQMIPCVWYNMTKVCKLGAETMAL
jgi:hypothetical protein